uniref:TP6A_N domain-containing protein n=1 Tax=Mesocestoides corti TaxID=53468 RepID=A0A5K3EMJ7_MESCO
MDVISRIEIFVLELLAELMNRGGLKHTSEKYVVLKKMRFPFAQVKNYTQISLFLSIVYKALKSGTYVTKRAIFYENPRV